MAQSDVVAAVEWFESCFGGLVVVVESACLGPVDLDAYAAAASSSVVVCTADTAPVASVVSWNLQVVVHVSRSQNYFSKLGESEIDAGLETA